MLAFSIDYYGIFFRATQSVELFCTYDIGFMGSEASVYMYSEGASDYVVNFAQLTQRAGNFLVARQDNEHFQWADLKGKTVLGGRKGGVHISM